MESSTLLKTRRSIRRFTDELVPKEVINEIIETTKFAPSWKNFQIARYNIIQNKDLIEEIGSQAVNDFIYNTKTLQNAQQICVLSYKKGISGTHEGKQATSKTDWEVFDAGIATLQFCLAAYEHGVGTVIMGIINDEKITELINLSKDEAVGAIIVFGYPQHEHPEAPQRKPIKELVRYIE